MRMLVVGAGSVGGYFGGRLAAAGRDVTFLVRPNRVARLSRGLEIVSEGYSEVIPVKVTTAGAAAGEFDVVLLAVKAYQLEDAVADFGPYVSGRTMILPVLNGMKHIDILRARFGQSRVVGGVALIAASLAEDGRILDEGAFHHLVYGEYSGDLSERITGLDEFMKDGGFDARLTEEIEREMWEKWALLASIGAITCLMDGNIGDVASTPGGLEFVRDLFAEVVAVIAAVWRPLSDTFKARIYSQLTDVNSRQTSSMYRDMKADHRIEADQIIGDLVTRAAKRRMATPLLSTILVRLKIYEQRQPSKSAPVQ
jgi:2-dehydropantoate 2-reductase